MLRAISVYAFNVISQQSTLSERHTFRAGWHRERGGAGGRGGGVAFCISEVSALRKIQGNIRRKWWSTLGVSLGKCAIQVSFFETKLLSLVFWKWCVFQCKYFALTTIAVIGLRLVKTLNDWSRGKQSNKINCFPRDQSLCNLLYSWKFWSWKFIKPRSNGGRWSTYTVTLWRHRSCNVSRTEILAGNSFIVRCHVTSK